MAITPPDNFIEWATDGGADKAKPSLIQYARGFQTADRDEFNSDLGYVNNLTSRWSKFNAQVNAAEIAVRNVTYYESSFPFTAAVGPAQALHIRFDSLAEKWYATSADATTSADIRCFDSDDGITWSAEKKVVTADANDESCTAIWSNGTVCAMATTEHSGPTAYMWISTDNTVANLAKMTGSFNNIAYVTDFLYDQFDSKWYALGRNSALTDGYLESSSNGGASWTVEHSALDNFRAMATDQLGNAVIRSDDTGLVQYCATAGGGMDGFWFAGGTGIAVTRAHYLAHLDAFVSVGVSGSCELHMLALISASPFDTDYDFDMCAFTEDTVIFEGDTGTRSTAGQFYTLIETARLKDSFNMGLLPSLRSEAGGDCEADTTYSGGQGKLVVTYGALDRIAVLTYGPKNG